MEYQWQVRIFATQVWTSKRHQIQRKWKKICKNKLILHCTGIFEKFSNLIVWWLYCYFIYLFSGNTVRSVLSVDSYINNQCLLILMHLSGKGKCCIWRCHPWLLTAYCVHPPDLTRSVFAKFPQCPKGPSPCWKRILVVLLQLRIY